MKWMRKLYNYMASYTSMSTREAYVNYRYLDLGMNKNCAYFTEASLWGRQIFQGQFQQTGNNRD